MSGIGVFFALDDETTEKLRKMRSREKRVDFVTDDIENLYFEEHAEFVLDTDHWWAEINIVLTEGTFKIGEGSHALGLAVFDGKQLGLPDEYILSLKTPEQVTEISAALDKVKKADFRKGYFEMEPEECDVVIDEASLGCTWDEFEKMRAFYRLALKSKRHVLFTTDA